MTEARTRDKAYRHLGSAGRPDSDGFEIPSYSGPMDSLLNIVRFGPTILGVPRTLVLLFIAERTVAYRKLADATSLAQIVDGVYRKQGPAVQWVRMGCGLKHSAAVRATASLVDMGLLGKRKRSDAKRGNLPTQYEIRWQALHSYLTDKSEINMPPLIHSAEKGSFKPLQTDLSETPLSAPRTSPYPPDGQEQYLDSNSTSRGPILAAMSAFDNTPLNESNYSKADYSFASAETAEGSEFAFPTVSLSKARNRKADYSLASAKLADGSANVQSCPQARKPTSKPANPDSEQALEVLVERRSVASPEHLPVPVPDPPAMDPPTLAHAKPWTAYELQTVRDCGSPYMEGDTPPANFESNCELAAVGHTAADVIAYLDSKFAKRRYRPGGKSGPSSWNWFYAVLRERFSARERGRLPEPPAVPDPAHQATAEQMDRGYDVLDFLAPDLAGQRS